jgi:hypothetical protein
LTSTKSASSGVEIVGNPKPMVPLMKPAISAATAPMSAMLR